MPELYQLYPPTATASTVVNSQLNTFVTGTTTNVDQWYQTTSNNANAGFVTYPQVYYQPMPQPYRPQQPSRRSRLEHRQPRAVDAEAVQRARELLYEHLDEEQQASYRQDLCFETVGSNGTRYRIEWGHAGNVLALDRGGRPWRRYCCHPSGYANEDTLLTQKLLLETDENRFLAIANIDTTPVDCEAVFVGAEA